METIKNTIELAKKGNIEAKRIIREHYFYLVNYYHKKYKDKITIEEVKDMYEEIMEEYYNRDNNTIHLVLYLHKHFIIKLHKKCEVREIIVKRNVALACKGDITAKNNIIEYYSKVVKEKAKEYNYLEYEELVQFGILKLIEYINVLIKEHQNGEFFMNGIPRCIDIYFDRTLRKKVDRWNMPTRQINDELENKIVEMEFNNEIDLCTANEKKRYILKRYFLGNDTYDLIGNDVGESRESIRKVVKQYQPVLKKKYIK